MSSHSVVVLNAVGQYWGEVGLKRVIKWLGTKKIRVILEKEDTVIRGISIEFPLPMVVQLLHFKGYTVKNTNIEYSKWAVFERDDNICQYWHFDEKGRRFKYRCTELDRTLDHVIPKAQGGNPRSFENSVTCCTYHNIEVKGNQTPKEAGLVLIRKPFTPKAVRGEWVRMSFTFNPNKLCHRYYVEELPKALGAAV